MSSIRPDTLRAAFAASALAPLQAHLGALARPAIHLSTRAVSQAVIATGSSQLGGQPDLLPTIPWPEKQGVPMSFVGQIRLEEVKQYDTEHALQSGGLLSFFYDAQQETYGTDPGDRDGFRVLYTPGDYGDLQRLPFPPALPASARFAPCTLTFSGQMTLAQQPDLEIPGLTWTPDQQQQYEAAVARLLSQPSSPQDQLLGLPNTLQDDMRAQCALTSHGVSIENAGSDPNANALAGQAPNWRLLLQVDSDGNASMRWGDGGMLYFWIEGDALKRASFDNVWAVLQTT
jgi:uncharacterized protein YwqG